MENLSLSRDVLLLEGLEVSPLSSAAAFALLLLAYVFVVVSNLSLVVVICRSSGLQQPMYLLICNMSVNDVFGASVIVPHLLGDLFLAERRLHYATCALQAFCVHLHATASHTVLMIMAFDRYVAICNPLRYAAVMTGAAVVKLSAAAWASALVPVAVLVGLSVRLSRCRRFVASPFCDNASLFQLSCESLLVNHVYGLGFTALLLGSSIGSVTLTYLRIAAVCVRSRDAALNGRALQTCATHLAVYALLLLLAFLIVALHRFPQLAQHRKAASVLGHVVLPALNAVIYGLQMKEVRRRMAAAFGLSKVRTQPET